MPTVVRDQRMLGYLGLFSSMGTLLCCALPSLLVLFGLGGAVASTMAAAPWLAALSRHKAWLFAGSALLIVGNVYYVYRLAPRLAVARGACPPGEADACRVTSRFSRAMLWVSVAVYATGFTVAYVLPLVLERIDG